MTEQGGEPQQPDPIEPPLQRVETELCALAGQIAAATSRFLGLLADFDRRKGWEGVNIRSCAHWLSWRCGMTLRTAHEQVRVARALAGLPLVREAFDAGRISYSKVRAIARVATATSEPDLLNAALHAPAAHVERLVRGLRTAQRGAEDLGEDVADNLGLRPLPQRRDRYRVGWHWDDHGDLVVSGRLSAEDGARLLAAVTRAQAAPEQDSDTGSWMRAPSDLASGLVAMAEMVSAGLAAPVHAPAAEVQVTVDIDTLVGALAPESVPDPDTDVDTDTAGRIDDGPALTAACLRRLVDDGRINVAVLAADGRTIDLGRTRRTPNEAQLKALYRRDRGCAMPGCDRTRFLHAHHVVFWARGGKTELDNLLLLCGEHHRDLHERRFSIRALGRQRFEFTGPGFRGTLIEPAPSMAGTAEELRESFSEVDPTAIIPDWDGTPVHGWAIAAYLTAWRQSLRHKSSRAA